MQKKFLAAALSGMMVFNSFSVVYAANVLESKIAVSVKAVESGSGFLLCSAGDGSESGLSLNKAVLKSLASKLGIDLSDEDIANLSGKLKDRETLKQKFGGLFTKGGIGAKALDIAGGSSEIGAVVDSMKDGEGGYDMDKILDSLENAVEKDGSVVIGGTAISKKDISAAIKDVLKAYGSSR